jgi:hypothetical protein
MRPDLFVLGLLPLTGGIVYVFCTKWIKETNLLCWKGTRHEFGRLNANRYG